MSDIKSMPSLVVGGALFGLLKRLGLCDDDLGRWRRRIVVIVAIVWLPLLLLSLAEGLAVGGRRCRSCTTSIPPSGIWWRCPC